MVCVPPTPIPTFPRGRLRRRRTRARANLEPPANRPDRLRGIRNRHLLAALPPRARGRRGRRTTAAEPETVGRRRPHPAALLPDACLDALFLLFPDPWPKAATPSAASSTRHCCRHWQKCCAPAPNGALPPTIQPISNGSPRCWPPSHGFTVPPPTTARPTGWPPTRYEAKAEKAGRQPRYWSLTRAAPLTPVAT